MAVEITADCSTCEFIKQFQTSLKFSEIISSDVEEVPISPYLQHFLGNGLKIENPKEAARILLDRDFEKLSKLQNGSDFKRPGQTILPPFLVSKYPRLTTKKELEEFKKRLEECEDQEEIEQFKQELKILGKNKPRDNAMKSEKNKGYFQRS